MIVRERAIQMAYGIPGMMWPSELNWIFDNFSGSRRHVEVGAYCGKSTLVTAASMKKGSHIVCVDNFSLEVVTANWTRKVFYATKMVIQNNTGNTVELVDLPSLAAFRQVHSRGITFDSVFIDGDHNYAECKADIEAWSSLVRPGGIIAGHDYWPNHSGVMDAVNETGPFEVAPGTRIWYRRRA